MEREKPKGIIRPQIVSNRKTDKSNLHLFFHFALATMKDASSMFVRGSKKMTLLKEVARKQNKTYGNRKVVFDICVTRWVENLDGYNMMLHTLPYNIESFSVNNQVDYHG